MSDINQLPQWDLTPYFDSLTSERFTAAYNRVIEQISDLTLDFDKHGIGHIVVTTLTTDMVAVYESVALKFDQLELELRLVDAYVYGHIATDSTNAVAQGIASSLRGQSVALQTLNVRWIAWLGCLDTDRLKAHSKLATLYSYPIELAKIGAKHQMSGPEEELSAQLRLSGTSAWSRLHSDITSQMTVKLSTGDTPMAMVRVLSSDADPHVRKEAYDAELAAWPSVSLSLAAAMNGIKHETNVLATRRGWENPLDEALWGNAIDRETLDAMLAAAKDAFVDFRRYMQAKAKLLGYEGGLHWHDLFAPIGADSSQWSWPVAKKFVVTHFDSFSPRLGDFARTAFADNWVDAQPRPGKEGGAFCMGTLPGESRILQNYNPSFDAVSTLAHELGHGYHNLCLKDRPPTISGTPMTLAETASIFCETIIKNAALRHVSDNEQLSILEASLQGQCQVVVDIVSRFTLEQSVLEQRNARELSVDELCKLMAEAQEATYGDGLSERRHNYMWAAKGHYYGSTYYNYPYMFGLLFGLGLYAIYQNEPTTFVERYDDLLSSTGMGDAATLAARFGVNIRDRAFWDASFDVIRSDINVFVAIADKAATAGNAI